MKAETVVPLISSVVLCLQFLSVFDCVHLTCRVAVHLDAASILMGATTVASMEGA